MELGNISYIHDIKVDTRVHRNVIGQYLGDELEGNEANDRGNE